MEEKEKVINLVKFEPDKLTLSEMNYVSAFIKDKKYLHTLYQIRFSVIEEITHKQIPGIEEFLRKIDSVDDSYEILVSIFKHKDNSGSWAVFSDTEYKCFFGLMKNDVEI